MVNPKFKVGPCFLFCMISAYFLSLYTVSFRLLTIYISIPYPLLFPETLYTKTIFNATQVLLLLTQSRKKAPSIGGSWQSPGSSVVGVMLPSGGYFDKVLKASFPGVVGLLEWYKGPVCRQSSRN